MSIQRCGLRVCSFVGCAGFALLLTGCDTWTPPTSDEVAEALRSFAEDFARQVVAAWVL